MTRAALRSDIARIRKSIDPGSRMFTVEYQDGTDFDARAFLRTKGVETAERDLIVCIRHFGEPRPPLVLPRYIPATSR